MQNSSNLEEFHSEYELPPIPDEDIQYKESKIETKGSCERIKTQKETERAAKLIDERAKQNIQAQIKEKRQLNIAQNLNQINELKSTIEKTSVDLKKTSVQIQNNIEFEIPDEKPKENFQKPLIIDDHGLTSHEKDIIIASQMASRQHKAKRRKKNLGPTILQNRAKPKPFQISQQIIPSQANCQKTAQNEEKIEEKSLSQKSEKIENIMEEEEVNSPQMARIQSKFKAFEINPQEIVPPNKKKKGILDLFTKCSGEFKQPTETIIVFLLSAEQEYGLNYYNAEFQGQKASNTTSFKERENIIIFQSDLKNKIAFEEPFKPKQCEVSFIGSIPKKIPNVPEDNLNYFIGNTRAIIAEKISLIQP